MQISELIALLEEVKAKHNDIEIGIFEYAGGMDRLCVVKPVYDGELDMILLDTFYHHSGMTR